MARIGKRSELFSRVEVDSGKITGYLLNQNHEQGKTKAAFFAQLGFSLSASGVFSDALSEHCRTAHLADEQDTVWGKKYTFSCEIQSPKSKPACIVSVWQIDKGGSVPRLITAYPSADERA